MLSSLYAGDEGITLQIAKSQRRIDGMQKVDHVLVRRSFLRLACGNDFESSQVIGDRSPGIHDWH